MGKFRLSRTAYLLLLTLHLTPNPSIAQVWVEVNEALGAVTDMAKIDGMLYTISNTGVLGSSGDNGASWKVENIYESVNLENGILNCLDFFEEDEGIIGVRDIGLGNELLRTRDSGKSWVAEDFSLVDSCGLGFIPVGLNVIDDTTAVLLGFRNSTYRITENKGSTWACSKSFTTPPVLQSLYIQSDDTWQINDLNGIYSSIDRGKNWEQILSKRIIHHQLLDDSINISLSSTFDEGDGTPKLVLTKDNFQTVKEISLIDLKNLYAEHFVAISETDIFVLVNGTEVYFTSDQGANFRRIQELSNQPLRTINFGDDWYLAGRGLWKLDKSISSINGSSTQLEDFKIYPNPTIGTLIIENQEFVSYQIFDTHGKLLVQGSRQGTSIDVGSLRYGTYFLKIDTPEGPKVQRFVRI